MLSVPKGSNVPYGLNDYKIQTKSVVKDWSSHKSIYFSTLYTISYFRKLTFMSCEKLKIRLIVVSTFWAGKINSQKFSNIEILEESISNKILVVLGI